MANEYDEKKEPPKMIKPFVIHGDISQASRKTKEEVNKDKKEEEIILEKHMEEDQKQMIKPFVVGDPVGKNMIKPFVVGDPGGVNQKDQASKEATIESSLISDRELEVNRPMVNPFIYISENNDENARIALEMTSFPKQMKETLQRYVARGFEENPQLQQLVKTLEEECVQRINLNFKLELIRILKKIIDTEKGEKVQRYYVLKITVYKRDGGFNLFETTVDEAKVKGIEWLKKATGSLAKIPSEKAEKQEYEAMIQQCIETERVPVEYEYPNPGWREIPEVGWRYVFGTGAVGLEGSWIHTALKRYTLKIEPSELGQQTTFQQVMQMAEICKNQRVSRSLLLYVHATMLTTLFELAGYPLCFVFIVQGITNSRKTSMVTAMAKIFDREKLIADAEFATATNCGLEKTASTYRDGPVLIDDFKPGATPAQQKEIDRKLDELIRLYGNRVSKKRMTDFAAKGDEKYFPVGGGCILTAEFLTGVSSTLTRAFVTEIGIDDVRNDWLSVYQTQRWILPTHIYDFLHWVTERFQRIVETIRNRYPILRNQREFRHGRYSEMFATLCITAELLSQYAVERKFWGINEQDSFLSVVQENVLTILNNNEEGIREKDKSRIVLQAFKEALNTAKVVAAELNEETSKRIFALYESAEFYYIRKDKLLFLVSEYCRSNFKSVAINEDELLMILENAQVLDVKESNGKRERSRKLPIQKSNHRRYLYLSKAAIEATLAE